MRIYIFPFLFISILFVLLIRIFMKKSSSGFDESVEEFIEKEKEANYITKNIENLDFKYIYPNKEILPFREYDEDLQEFKNIIKKQSLVQKKIGLEMIKLPLGLSNTDLKVKYGVNNFEKITILEEHYNGFIRAMFEWGALLYDMGKEEDCVIVLEECVRLEGDISQIYFKLIDIYVKNNQKEKIFDIREKVLSYDLSLKEKILSYIQEKIQKL